jgi:hypothetical protein
MVNGLIGTSDGWGAIYFKPLSTMLGDEMKHRCMSLRWRGGPWILSVVDSTEPKLGVETFRQGVVSGRD